MTIRLTTPLALLALCCAAPGFAAANPDGQAEQSAEQPAAADAKPAKQRKVCRTETATGSVMPKRVCRTAEQMEQDERNAEQFRDRQNRMGSAR